MARESIIIPAPEWSSPFVLPVTRFIYYQGTYEQAYMLPEGLPVRRFIFMELGPVAKDDSLWIAQQLRK